MITGMDALFEEQVSRIAEFLHRTLDGTVTGLYLFGSCIKGGLRPASDLDLFVAVNKPLTAGLRRELVGGLLGFSGSGAGKSDLRPVELTVVVMTDVVPWRYPPQRDLQFGEWLRNEFEKGIIPPPQADPDLAVLLTTVRQDSYALYGPAAAQLFDPVPAMDLRQAIMDSVPGLVASLEGDERNVLLTLARMWVTLSTGEIVPKDIAADRLSRQLPPEHSRILSLAKSAYIEGAHFDWDSLRQEIEALVCHMKSLIIRFASEEGVQESGKSNQEGLLPDA